ncbi:MAG TPA: PGPGW domain-containing protein [Geobacteraceae bacterium]|nr:PGPGW domain-containing protein [Geobacteraceae bacterium]
MSTINWTLRQAKRAIITVVGFTVLGIGVAMIVLPGPAIVVIPVGLGILATEFVWARTLLKHVKERIARVQLGYSINGNDRPDG